MKGVRRIITQSNDPKEQVETLIKYVSEREGVRWTGARTMVHKYVCGGKCDWYRTKRRRGSFDRRDLPNEERIEEAVRTVMSDLPLE